MLILPNIYFCVYFLGLKNVVLCGGLYELHKLRAADWLAEICSSVSPQAILNVPKAEIIV